jgi:hypothetical protein
MKLIKTQIKIRMMNIKVTRESEILMKKLILKYENIVTI